MDALYLQCICKQNSIYRVNSENFQMQGRSHRNGDLDGLLYRAGSSHPRGCALIQP